jgi:hypothetical protein
LDQRQQRITLLPAHMEMHDAALVEQFVAILIDPGPVIFLGHAIAAFNTFDDFVQFRAQ